MPPPDNTSSAPLLALCPCSGGLTGLALDAGAPLDDARPFRTKASSLASPAACPELLSVLDGSSRNSLVLLVDDNSACLLSRLKGREAALPVGDMLPPGFFSPGGPRRDGDSATPEHPVLRPSTIGRMNKYGSTDRSHAFLAGMLSLPPVTERSRRHGLTLLWLDPERVYAALVFRGALHAMAGLSFPALFNPEGDAGYARGSAALARLLDDFRLGWLPEEEAARRGGVAWRAASLPPEAEGFMPFFAAGPEAGMLTGFAMVMPDAPERILCRGLLHGYRLAESAFFVQNDS